MMGYGYGYGMGPGGWLAMAIFWVALLTLVVWGLSYAFSSGRNRDAASTAPGSGGHDGAAGTAEDILDRRFAAGELDEDIYRSMRATLRSSGAARTDSR